MKNKEDLTNEKREIEMVNHNFLRTGIWKWISDYGIFSWCIFDDFLTDTFGVPAAAVGVITVVASIWDAVNDPMMGAIADRTNTRWGKYRPYFLFVPAALTVVVVLLFANPNIGTTGKIIWTAVFYVLYGMLRTAIEIPSGALINAVTDEPSERNKMINAYTMVMGICTTIATSFGLSLVSFFGGKIHLKVI